ncbi:hepatocyte growth factor regulated tyrosine kinase substrate isoform X2 [Anticarsia gemmatalis]|uniref:hepatocyte growth factor regulated tyrosine kinase substrate isoform X2 n=1 Tax=Anticarsia gemmatalis TaxID=129554 RepID=UPI003F76D4B7
MYALLCAKQFPRKCSVGYIFSEQKMDTVNILKAEGYKFPTLKESDAMFSADTAPEWAEGEVCHRCRVAFSLMVRRHHCRACGQVFCQQCSSKTSTLPKFGIEKEVRVCDACFDKVSRPPVALNKLEIVDTSNDYGPTQPQKRTGGKTAEELQEEEELQLALALSQSEAEHKEKERKSRAHIAPDPTPHHPTVSPTPSSVSASPEHSTQATSELSRYLDRNYWEQRLSRDNAVAPTAPAPASHASDITEEFPKPAAAKSQDDDSEDKEIDEFVESLKSQVEIFVNRMKSNSSRGRSIANDTSVQTLFMNITAMHSRLLRFIQQQDDKRVYLESLQDKVTQIRDSRAALDTLRAEHAARLAAAAEAAERQRQMQMAAKLQAMRKKKHEYLQYQRQLALQRVQEQEREMQMRQEQQKHQYLMSANSYYMPGVSMQQYQSGFPNQQMYGNPQFHPQMMPQATTESSVPMPGQPQMSTANIPMNITQMGTMQSMPQLTNTYGISTTAANINPTVSVQQSMNQPNLRPALGQQLPLQQQMLLQQMHQMRMPVQPGMHQIVPQSIANGLPGQNIPQQNGQNAPKQNLPNQPQQPPNSMMPQMSVAQQNMGQPQIIPSNPMMGLQMQNMRMPLMQGNQPNANQQVPVSQFQNMNIQNQTNTQQPGSQVPNMQSQSQIPMPGQPMSIQGQQIMPGQTVPGHPQAMQMNNNMSPTNQNVPAQGQQTPQGQGQQMPQQMTHQQQIPSQQQIAHNPQMALPGQGMPPPGQQMMMPGQQIPNQGQNMPQGQMMNQGQTPQGQLPHPGQQIGQGQPPSHPGQQMPPGHLPPGHQTHQIQMVHQVQMGGPMVGQLPPGQPMQGQIPQQIPGPQMQQPMPQGQPQNMPGQQIKMQQPNFNNMPQGQPQNTNQQAQTPVKSEHNNNTAELISFD